MSKRKVLLIDDEESLCRTIKLNLEETGGYDVSTLTDGTQAMDQALAIMPDVIILDVMLGANIDGCDV